MFDNFSYLEDENTTENIMNVQLQIFQNCKTIFVFTYYNGS